MTHLSLGYSSVFPPLWGKFLEYIEGVPAWGELTLGAWEVALVAWD